MYEEWLIAIVPNLLVAAFSIEIGYLAWRDSSKPYRRYFAFMIWLISPLALVLLGEKVVDNIDIVIALCILEYVLELALLLLLLKFVTEYTETPGFANRKFMFGLFVLGAISPLLLATNSWHHLFYTKVSLTYHNGFYIFNPTYGTVVALWGIFAIGILAICQFILMASYLHAPKNDKRGFAIVSVALFFITASTIIYWFSSKDNPLLDILALGLFGGVLIVYYGVFWRNILDAPPFTIIQLLENVYDGTVLIDENGRVAYWNAAARKILVDDQGTMLPIGTWFRDQPEYELILTKDGKETFWSVKASVVTDVGKSPGTVLVLSDITKMREYENALTQVNKKLAILQSVNRHDLRNDIVALGGYLELLGQNGQKGDPRILQAKKVLARMAERIDQLKDQQGDVPIEKIWVEAQKAAWNALNQLDVSKLNINVQLEGLEVPSEQLLERIFYNLAENSVRHGKVLTRISLTYRRENDRCVITYEDDGKGIPTEKKELVFEKGYGDNTGMGLYLTREIARNTGMTIIENGTAGARFELTIPAGRWRDSGPAPVKK
ncbi:MAG: sensory histidine kinase AtoS [Methanomassiliicoccales archaeon PtaU1.Bin124]|nr:MAG: sensory histidine kinase AtoS [Methanomassiliicoccales archaeon PtaU1.Bin124]